MHFPPNDGIIKNNQLGELVCSEKYGDLPIIYFNQGRDYGYYDQPTHPTGQKMSAAAMVAGIICLVTLWTLYLPIIVGALGVIFGFLSLGFEKKLSSNAKMGLIFSAVGFTACLTILLGGAFFLYHNPERFLEAARLLDMNGPAREIGFSYEETVSLLINLFK